LADRHPQDAGLFSVHSAETFSTSKKLAAQCINLKPAASCYVDDLLSQGLIYCDPPREFNFWQPTPSALLTLGLRSSSDIQALKEFEEWFDSLRAALFRTVELP
jgi:hypothetical protein